MRRDIPAEGPSLPVVPRTQNLMSYWGSEMEARLFFLLIWLLPGWCFPGLWRFCFILVGNGTKRHQNIPDELSGFSLVCSSFQSSGCSLWHRPQNDDFCVTDIVEVPKILSVQECTGKIPKEKPIGLKKVKKITWIFIWWSFHSGKEQLITRNNPKQAE